VGKFLEERSAQINALETGEEKHTTQRYSEEGDWSGSGGKGALAPPATKNGKWPAARKKKKLGYI